MAWNTPKTWSAGEKGRSTDLNTYVSDNLEYLHSGRPRADTLLDEASDYTTSSKSWVDIDATDLAYTITPTTTRVRVCFHGYFNCWVSGANANVRVDLNVDGNRYAGDDGLGKVFTTATSETISSARLIAFDVIIPDLDATAHTIKLQWIFAGTGSSPTAKLYAGGGTSGMDLHPHWTVEEWR